MSDVIGPREIVTGRKWDYKRHCKLQFGEYAQVYDRTYNTLTRRTTAAIAMYPSGNYQGGHYFFSLRIGRRLCRNRWVAIPMPDEVIVRIEDMAGDAPEGINFEYKNMVDEENSNTESMDENDDMSDDDENYTEGDDAAGSDNDDLSDGYLDEADPDEAVMWENLAAEEAQEWPNDEPNEDEDTDEVQECINEPEHDEDKNIDHMDVPEDNTGERRYDPWGDASIADDDLNDEDKQRLLPDDVLNDNDGSEQVAVVADANDRRGMYHHRLRSNRKPSFTHIQERGKLKQSTVDWVRGAQQPPSTNELEDDFHSTILTQYHVSKGLRIFGDAGKEAVLKEMRQFDDMDTIEPMNPNNMSKEDVDGALEYLMFLKEKRCGKIKGRGCADGRPQRLYTGKDESPSKTVTVESVMLTSMVDAMERRDVATVDIPGAFLQTDMNELVYMVIRGKLVDTLLKNNRNKYEEFVVYKNGVKILYGKLKKALYGTLRASLLFWRNLTSNLKK